MKSRPFQNLSEDDLDVLAKRQWSSAFNLGEIAAELRSRPTGAGALRTRIEARLQELSNGKAEWSKKPENDGSQQNTWGAGAQSAPPRPARQESVQELNGRIVRLEAELTLARARIADLERNSSGEDPIYKRVGLHPSCPDFVVKAVRKSYLRELHPDTKPDHHKDEAERRFKIVEDVFSKIYAARKLK